MTVLASVGGAVLIALAARDIFDALFHPEGRGTFARLVARGVWHGFRCTGRASPLAGPVALLAVIATWVVLLVIGWALIYLPHFPEAFTSGAERGDLVEAMHLSLTILTTLGSPDLTPDANWLRIVAPLEALIGFGLLSASISWILLIYPVLARRRSLAYEIALLRQAEREEHGSLASLDPGAAERLYAELTSRLIAVERDLVNFPITYYFAESDERFSLLAVAPYLLGLAERGAASELSGPERLRARLLREAIDDLAATVKRFHPSVSGTTAELLRTYAQDHLRMA
jgi:hypothetical protein